MTPERMLWLAVLYQAFRDATSDRSINTMYASHDLIHAKQGAHEWIAEASRDYYRVCALAGMDGDFLRDAYLAGRMDPAILRTAKAGRAALQG